jgi:NhaP-type Na+/H+ or K+/H+ antiporter
VTGVILVLAVAILWVLVSRRLSRRSVTAPIALSLAGLLLASGPHPIVDVQVDSAAARTAVSITLALVLFVDASTVGFGWFRTQWRWPAQLLLIGLPLTIGANYLASRWLFPSLSPAVLGALAAALAPTHAALSAAGARRPADPGQDPPDDQRGERSQRWARDSGGAAVHRASANQQTGEVAFFRELVIGIAAGLALGLVGGHLLHLTDSRGWSVRDEEPIAALSFALLAYFVAGELHGNGFIAAFAAGLAFGARLARRETRDVLELSHQVCLLLSFVVWFLFGAVLLPSGLHSVAWQTIVFSVLALTALRMIPVALASFGIGERSEAVALVGWLGPRCLASIVFALLVVEKRPAGAADPTFGSSRSQWVPRCSCTG